MGTLAFMKHILGVRHYAKHFDILLVHQSILQLRLRGIKWLDHMNVTDKRIQTPVCPCPKTKLSLLFQCFSKYGLRQTVSKSPEMLVKNTLLSQVLSRWFYIHWSSRTIVHHGAPSLREACPLGFKYICFMLNDDPRWWWDWIHSEGEVPQLHKGRG